MKEQVVALPDGGEWIVQAFRLPPDEAKAEFDRIEEGSLHKKGNFSIWRSMYPHDRTMHMIVVCARREHLPTVHGENVEIDERNAQLFALRRAKTGLDGLNAGQTEVEQLARYGVDAPVRIDDKTGDVFPYVEPPAGGSA